MSMMGRRGIRRWLAVGVVGLLASAATLGAQAPTAQNNDLPFGAMGGGAAPPTLPPVPLSVKAENKKGTPTSAAGWRARGESLADSGQFTDAAEAYRQAGRIYAEKGDPNAAKVMELQAQRYETRLEVFLHKPTQEADVRKYYTGKRLEPMYGAYIGAFIDREDGVNSFYMANTEQKHKSSSEFNQTMGKKHAVFLTYQQYGKPFPETWLLHLKANGAAAQWALQPSSLDEIKDDDYLRDLAKSAAEVGIPIFLRFASEMNGSWTPYSGNPEAYKQKFQLVARVFHQLAPNVAMVWCPNEIPENKLDAYYPGPDAVDWVGVNFYSVYYIDNDLSRPYAWHNPSDSLDYIYRKYSATHPILIGEYAATHLATADNQPRGDFAADKIGQLYASLPRRYPRVKAVHWFSMNAIKWAPPDRRLNDYSLLDDPKVAATYKRMVAPAYFLSEVKKGEMAKEEITPFAEGATLSGRVRISAYVKTYVQRPVITYSLNGKPIPPMTDPGDYRIVLDTRRLPNGPVAINITVKDNKGKVAAQRTINAKVANG